MRSNGVEGRLLVCGVFGAFQVIRPLLIVGPPGCGKSELAQRVAARAERPLKIADARSLQACLTQGEAAVIDVSSEAWLRRETRVMALDHAVVISVEGIVGRDGTGASSGDGSEADLLWLQATAAFCEAHRVVAFDEHDLQAIVEDVMASWRRDPIAVAVGERSYVVEVGRGIAEERCRALLQGQAALMLITDSNVERLHGPRMRRALTATGSRIVSVVFAAGEEQKQLGTLREIYEQAQQGGIDRSSRVVAFGGGVVTDIGGLVAADMDAWAAVGGGSHDVTRHG